MRLESSAVPTRVTPTKSSSARCASASAWGGKGSGRQAATNSASSAVGPSAPTSDAEQLAAAHVDRLAGDEVGFARAQEGDGVGLVLRSTWPSERARLGELAGMDVDLLDRF